MFRSIQKLIKALEIHNKRGLKATDKEKEERARLECKASVRI
jgi:hypothetical protein